MELQNEEYLTGLIWGIVERSFYTPFTDKLLTGYRAERIGDYRNLLYRECKNLARAIADRVAELEAEIAVRDHMINSMAFDFDNGADDEVAKSVAQTIERYEQVARDEIAEQSAALAEEATND